MFWKKTQVDVLKSKDDYLLELLTEAREELTRADTKISILFASIGVVLGVLFLTVADNTWSPANLPLFLFIIWAIGAISVFISCLLLGIALYPKVKSNKRQIKNTIVTYYEDIARLPYSDFLNESDNINDLYYERILKNQLHVISTVVLRKYLLLRTSLWFLLVGISLLLITLMSVAIIQITLR